jgi:hypothetical protein
MLNDKISNYIEKSHNDATATSLMISHQLIKNLSNKMSDTSDGKPVED